MLFWHTSFSILSMFRLLTYKIIKNKITEGLICVVCWFDLSNLATPESRIMVLGGPRHFHLPWIAWEWRLFVFLESEQSIYSWNIDENICTELMTFIVFSMRDPLREPVPLRILCGKWKPGPARILCGNQGPVDQGLTDGGLREIPEKNIKKH